VGDLPGLIVCDEPSFSSLHFLDLGVFLLDAGLEEGDDFGGGETISDVLLVCNMKLLAILESLLGQSKFLFMDRLPL